MPLHEPASTSRIARLRPRRRAMTPRSAVPAASRSTVGSLTGSVHGAVTRFLNRRLRMLGYRACAQLQIMAGIEAIERFVSQGKTTNHRALDARPYQPP